MLRNIVLLLILLFESGFELHSQVHISSPRDVSNLSIVDSGSMRVLYALNAIDLKDHTTYDDLQILEIGEKISKYYSFFIFNSDSLVTDFGLKKPNSGSIPNRMGVRGKDVWWSEYYYSEYFKNLEKHTFTEYTRMPYALEKMKLYCVENIPQFNWSIHPDTLSIMTYLCQKATCHFRGRDYIAWFALDIPISNGPWKFGGLPGLILKVYDENGIYQFECIKIENHKRKYPIKTYNYGNYKEIEKKKLLKFQKEIHENYHKVAGLTTGDFINGKFVPNNKSRPKIKYEPLELE
jgi:GLPGLI family protein